ncbi:DUF6941 family protein [Gemmatimonas sp.]|uniref:DUF6941 family protein n=1 Tax=Gemmatimonas sp. TaxID=1962908 RepID=UPI00356A41D6
MHVSFALFADAANISQEGKLNILGVFDAVHVGQLPALHPRATFVVRIKAVPGDAGDHPMTLRWVNPRGAELWVSNAELSIAPPPPGTTELDMPVIVQLDLPLDLTGDYRMIVELRDEKRGEALLHVKGQQLVPGAAAGMVS